MQKTEPFPSLDPQRRDELSDTVLYNEARQFVNDHPPPQNRQLTGHLVGLSGSGRRWEELLQFINHQRKRESLSADYRTFYDALSTYLDDSKTGLRARVRSDFRLLDESLELNRKQEQEITRRYAQELAQLFLQHLVAEALVQKHMEEPQ
jgi:hypothetical protein